MHDCLPRNPTLALPALLAALTVAPVPATATVVHEWGTFTTLVTSWGQPLEGLYIDATRLPAFVHGLPFFNYGSAGWPSPENLRGVTVKMETPVLYFYSEAEAEQPVTVRVGFEGGTISQWFPQRHAGETNPAGPVVDLGAQPYQGGITWKAKVLPRNSIATFTHAREEAPETREWRAPRLPGSNFIEGESGEIEKFLFYRGLGNFPMALSLRFEADGKLSVRNGGAEAIPFVLVFQRDEADGLGGMPYIWWKGSLAAGEGKSLTRPDSREYSVGMDAMEELHKAMMAQGLYADEARALLNTWYDGYFHESGLKAFWILPRKQVDRLLPLEISPAPDSLERVIIGRSEILPPEFEAKLAAEGGTLPGRAQDKYHLAYLDFLDSWQTKQATPVTPRGRSAASHRPWNLVLPWDGPFASPALRTGRGGAGKAAAVDLRGRVLAPYGPIDPGALKLCLLEARPPIPPISRRPGRKKIQVPPDSADRAIGESTMISDLGPIHPGERPRPQAMAAANLAANRPNAADLRRLALDMRPSKPELPFLKPLAGDGLGQNINTVI